MTDVVIIGAGASGLVTAIVAGRRGKKVLILEKNNKVGKKLLATGNGKCNIGNQRPTLERFYSHNPKFIAQVFEGYGYQDIKQFFKSIGLELIEAKEGKVFPMSLQASSVVELLISECEQLGIKIICDAKVKKVSFRDNSFSLEYNDINMKSKKLVLATGHCSAPQLGGVMDGIGFARSFGHNIIKDFPTLVQLTSPFKEQYLSRMAGVKVESRVTLNTKSGTIQKQGDVLFTNYGLSGLAILDISRKVMEELKSTPEVTLEIDLMPKMSIEQLHSMMKKSLLKKSLKPLEIWMQGFINKKLILPILEPLKLEDETIGSIASNLEKLEPIVSKIKCFSFKINGNKGYKGAEVATGGIDTKEVEAHSMESKKQKGLYLVGEVLDVDGDRGGFNLHLAWVCGLRAGEAL
ncbi:MAG: NAD(FAD)-utilizing dehydrogenases [uncultured Sulfurovum sp.]|uniref:NAD(FAD)-utilizing dehydrogenases n=1 Tax=uncultured Sulfurovum sp. TaxID=269237 RepID=A0A6S6SQV5_9BACT|nr:MAG: NAD(FAD)-utilizing dehydrogenases [uncultured Sulfurovum sp.]